jgi:hypothetical protein
LGLLRGYESAMCSSRLTRMLEVHMVMEDCRTHETLL